MVKVVSRSFTLDKNQLKKLNKWKHSLPKIEEIYIVHAYTYEFNPFLDGEVVNNDVLVANNVSFKRKDFKNKVKVKRFDGHEIVL